MEVRPAGIDDAEAIAGVHVRTWQVAYRGQLPDDWLDGLTVERRRGLWKGILAESDLPRTGALVLEDGAEVTGFAHLSPGRDADATPSTGELTAIYLLPEVWRRGGGRLLMAAVLANLRAAGCERATLWVLETNTRARRFYEAQGWSPDGATKQDERGSFTLVEVRYTILL